MKSSEEFIRRTLKDVGVVENNAEREIYAKAWHFIGKIALQKGDTATWFLNTNQAIDSLEKHNSVNASGPLLELAGYHLEQGG